MANESIMQAFDRFTAHVLTLLENMRKENSDKYATKEYACDNGGKIDKILVNGNEQIIGIDKDVNIDLSDYATKEFVNTNSGKIDKILVNGVEQIIDGKTANVKIPEITESSDNALVYLTGVRNDQDDEYYSKEVYLNPSTGQINANIIDANKVYGAVWNDYAEWFEKQNTDEEFEPGDICAWDKTGVIKADCKNRVLVGVYSDTYGHILGGESLKDMELNKIKYVPIGLIGRVKVKVMGKVNIGDHIVASATPGVGIVDNNMNENAIGIALECKNIDDIDRITILIK